MISGSAAPPDLRGAAMKPLTAALEEAVVGCVLDQRVLETIARLRRDAVNEQDVGFRETLERGLQRRLFDFRDVAQEQIGEVTSKHRADLRRLTRGPEPVEARGERVLQGQRDRLCAALFSALEKEPGHLLDEQGHAAGALAHPLDHVL